MTIRMGYWDCPTCGQKRIEGPTPQCTSCGQPRGPKVQFYSDDAAPEVQDPELLARARAGTDWQCKFCGADNQAGHLECHQCGASADGMRRREERVHMDPTPPKQPSRMLPILLVLAAVVAVLFGGCWFLFFRAKPLEVTVEAATWTKTIETEKLVTERAEAWSDEVPKGAKELGRTTKAREKKVQEGTKKVKVGKKDLGNGTFEDITKEEPNFVTKRVDEPWVTFEIDKWVAGQTLKEESSDGKEPPSPRFVEGAKERVAKRGNKLALKLKGSNGKDYSFDVDLAGDKDPKATLEAYKKGSKHIAMITTAGGVRELKR
jgi:ribosomal protein L37E